MLTHFDLSFDTLIRLLLIQNENTKLPRHNGKATKEKNLLKFDSIIKNRH